jgi:lambda repressor-like predicted transcriptional regulator
MSYSARELDEIAAKVGVPWHRKRAGIDAERIAALREAGFSMDQIGAHFGVSRETVRRRMKGSLTYTPRKIL